jgi:ABC-type sugar transport system substrate-binding protein
MKKLKKILAFVFVVSLVFGTFAGCSSGSSEKTVTINGYKLLVPNKKPGKMEIALVYMNVTTPFAQSLKKGVDAAAKKLGVNAYMTAPTSWSTENEVNLIDNLIAKGVDGLAIAVLDIPALTPVIQKALKAGIPTVCWNVDAIDSGRLGFVGEDLKKAGEAAGQALVDKMGKTGTVLISTEDITAEFSIEREAGTRAVLDKYTGIKVLPTLNCPGDQQQMYSTIEAEMKSHPEITGSVSCGGTDFEVSKYLQNNNIGNSNSSKPIYNTGHDIEAEKVNQIINGWSTVQFGQYPYTQGYDATQMLVDFLKTGSPASFKDINTGLLRVDQSNATSIAAKIVAGDPIG